MQSHDIFEFILDTRIFLITSPFLNLNDVNPDIRSELILNKQYIVKSHVNENIFQSFINHWTKSITPNLNSENILEYEKLSLEFDRMNDIIQLFYIKNIGYDKIKKQNKKFKKETQKRSEELDKTNRKYQKIIYSLTRDSQFFSIQNKYPIYNAIKMDNPKLVSELTREKVVINGLIYVLFEEDKTSFLFGTKNKTSHIYVPYSIQHHSNEYIITGICQSAFHNSEDIKSIQFPENSELRSISRNAFCSSSIEYINIPSNVKKIGKYAFESCEQIQKVAIPENSELEIIDKSAFANSNLKRIYIPSKVTHIKENAFDCCEQLEEVIFAENSQLVSIDSTSFSETSIQKIVIPSHVKEIGNDSFSCCLNLQSVVFLEDSELEIIGEQAFSSSPLLSITIPSSVKELKEGWLSEIPNLKNITIIPTYEQNILYYNNEFILGKSDKTKDIYDVLIFARCDIEKVQIPSFITKIEPTAFDQCKQVQSFEFAYNSQLKTLEEGVFSGCSLRSLTIPSSVTKIDEGCFADSPNLIQINIMPNNRYFLYYNSQYILGKLDKSNYEYDVLIFARKDIQNALIPSFIKKIAPCAFHSCNQLQKVVFNEDSKLVKISKFAFHNSSLICINIPRHVKSIGECAFNHCENLLNVTFSDDSELEIIKNNAFSYCQSLHYISIPPRVTHLYDEVFYNCNNLANIDFADNSQLQFIGESAFVKTSIQNISIPYCIKQIEKNTFMSCKKLKKIEFPKYSELEIIKENAFNSSSLEDLLIPSSLVKFEKSWCHKASNLNILIFPNKEENFINYEDKFILGKSDLNNDFFDVLVYARKNIKKVIIPSFIKQIAPFAFHRCRRFLKIEFEDEMSLIKIGEYAFYSTNIESFIMPPNVETLENGTFCDSKELYKFEIPPNSQLKTIERSNFWESHITSISFPFSVTKIDELFLEDLKRLQIIEFSDNYELDPINERESIFATLIMVPAKFKKIFGFKF